MEMVLVRSQQVSENNSQGNYQLPGRRSLICSKSSRNEIGTVTSWLRDGGHLEVQPAN